MSEQVAKRSKSEKIGIIGSGLIGRSWSMLYAGAGYNVVMYDVAQTQLDGAITSIKEQLFDLEKQGLLRGSLSADLQFGLISTTNSLPDAVKGAKHVQECVPENLDLKIKVFKQINDACTSDDAVLCSSSSCILPSKIFTDIPRVAQCIIAHPCNPPYHCPLTEIIPHPQTKANMVQKTKELLTEIGQTAVVLTKEVDGFALNRLQYALINEAWRLVDDGIMSPEDVDKIFTSGLGMRYAFMGPFETIHLNAEGTRNYLDRYKESIRRVSGTFGGIPTFDGEALEIVDKEMSKRIPSTSEELNKRRNWRDQRLVALSKLKKEMDK